jgi:hypothetical protein
MSGPAKDLRLVQPKIRLLWKTDMQNVTHLVTGQVMGGKIVVPVVTISGVSVTLEKDRSIFKASKFPK